MAASNYLDFDLQIQRAGAEYRVHILNSPGGQASSSFTLPFSDLELENFLLRIGRPRRSVRRADSPETEAVKKFGGSLFSALFHDEVLGCLHASLNEATRREAGLRIRLRLTDTPELADLPWEYLYNPGRNQFLALSTKTPVLRYLEMPDSIRPVAITPPLRVLVMISSPNNHPRLNVEQEWSRLHESLLPLEEKGMIELIRLDVATLGVLQQSLRQSEFHVFHFIGHGGFDQGTQDGVLIFEDEAGMGRPVSGQDLGVLLHDHTSMRLAVLNACEGARASRSDPFAGTAQSLAQQGLPAVIAMQFEITDEAAIQFSREFYAAVADGYPVDASLAEARKAIFAQGCGQEWGTPVLYLRASDGRIFDVKSRREATGREVALAAAAAGGGVTTRTPPQTSLPTALQPISVQVPPAPPGTSQPPVWETPREASSTSGDDSRAADHAPLRIVARGWAALLRGAQAYSKPLATVALSALFLFLIAWFWLNRPNAQNDARPVRPALGTVAIVELPSSTNQPSATAQNSVPTSQAFSPHAVGMSKPAVVSPVSKPTSKKLVPKSAEPVAAPPIPRKTSEPRRVSANEAGIQLSPISHPKPLYPAKAIQENIEGVVVLRVIIGTDGAIKKVETVTGQPLLAQAAMDAVRQWTYQPTIVNGEPVEVDTQVTVGYKLPPSAPCVLGEPVVSDEGRTLLLTVPYRYWGKFPLEEVAVRGVPLDSAQKEIPGLTLTQSTLQSAGGEARFSIERPPSLKGASIKSEFLTVFLIEKATKAVLCQKTVAHHKKW